MKIFFLTITVFLTLITVNANSEDDYDDFENFDLYSTQIQDPEAKSAVEELKNFKKQQL